MILRAAIVLLLMLNLGAAAWWWLGGDAGDGAHAPAGGVSSGLPGAPGLRLLTEAAPVAAVIPPAALPVSASPASASAGTAEPAARPGAACMRFGPFADAASRDAARASLSSLASTVVARDTPGRASRGWWVLLPALPSRDEARALGERIKAAGITDWYVMGEGDQANGIALGRYGSENAARRREADIRAKGFPAQAAPLGDRAPQWWLDARIAPGATPTALAAIAPSRGIACAGLR